MSFVQTEYAVLLTLLLALYWWLPRQWQNALLVVTSFVFYGWVHPWLVALLLVSASLDYTAARGIAERPTQKLAFLRLSIVGNVLILGTFKYFDFFVESFELLLDAMGVAVHLPMLNLLLPMGISFYTFQTVSYTIDVYWGRTHARTNYLTYLLYVSFFPQLVAGPIERASHLLPQLESDRVFSWDQLRSGFSLVVWGAFKKVVIADTVAPYVDTIYAAESPSHAMIWSACILFMVQILADFTGYTDIARGTARMLGIDLMKNFNHPYLSKTPFELWDRWHISLSSWLRDYIFYPVASSKTLRTYLRIPGLRESGLTALVRASIVTMMFSGLWHGASWNFVLWGAFWAAVQVSWQVGERKFPRSWQKWRYKGLIQYGLMVPVHLVGHQLFRTSELSRLGLAFFSNPFAGDAVDWWLSFFLLELAALAAGILTIAMLIDLYVLPKIKGKPVYLLLEPVAWCVAMWAIMAFQRPAHSDFIYFAF